MRRLMQARSVPRPPRAATPTAKMTPAAATVEKPRLEPAKDYIHVRARLGQATDSHSLAERVRRERISKRMKIKPALSSSLTLRGGRDGGSDRDALISPMEDLICDLAA